VPTTSKQHQGVPLQLFASMSQFGVNVSAVSASVVPATVPVVITFPFGYRTLLPRARQRPRQRRGSQVTC
jgi:ABC-type glycerol-3-phosphate transport system permease component